MYDIHFRENKNDNSIFKGQLIKIVVVRNTMDFTSAVILGYYIININ